MLALLIGGTLYFSDQLLDITGFHQEIVSAQFHTVDARFDCGMSGQHDNLYQGELLFNSPERLKAVYARHFNIQYNRVKVLVGLQFFQTFLSAEGRQDLDVSLFQPFGHGFYK